MAGDPTTADDSVLLDRITAELRRTVDAIADTTSSLPWGWLASTPSMPLVHTLNQVHVSTPVPVAEILATAEGHQGHLPFRHVIIDDADTAQSFIAGAGDGWKTDREVVMALRREPSRSVDSTPIVELGEDETLALMRVWAIEDHLDTAVGVIDQLNEYSRREGALWREHRLGVRDSGGQAVAVTKFRHVDGTAWVEDVYTLPEARGRGHARMLVTEATARARALRPVVTFITADDQDWPKELYADVGFDPIGLTWTFHRPVP